MKRHYDGIKSINIDSSWPVAKTLHILVQQTHTNTQTHIICTFNIQYIAKLKPWALSFMNMYTTQTHTKMRENGSNLISLYINIIQVVWALTWLVHLQYELNSSNNFILFDKISTKSYYFIFSLLLNQLFDVLVNISRV